MVHDPYWDLETEPVEPAFDAARTALLIIDMQNMCAHPEGWMGRLARDQGKPGHLDERFDFIARDHARTCSGCWALPGHRRRGDPRPHRLPHADARGTASGAS